MADHDFISGALAGQQFQMNKMLMQEMPVKLEKEKLALKIAQTDFDARGKMAQMLADNAGKVPEGQDPLENAKNTLLQMGSAAAKVGLVEEAAADFAKSSTIGAQQEEAAYKKWQSTLQQTKYADQLLATATDEASWKAMNAHVRMTTGKPSALEGQKYSPQLVEELRKASQTKRSDAQEALDKARAKREQGLIAADAELVRLRKTQEGLNVARTDAAKKAGGGDGLIAKPKNIAAVTDAIVKDSGDTMAPGDARVFAREIALDAEKRMSQERLTQPQAVAAAVDYAKKHGVLAGITPAHVRPGQSAKKALPLPQAKSDPKQYKDQMWYQAPDGPRWYDAETQKLYKAGEGPEEEEE